MKVYKYIIGAAEGVAIAKKCKQGAEHKRILVKLIPNGQTKPDRSKEFLNAEAGKVDDYVVKALREEYFWTKEPIYLDPIDF